MVSDGPPRDRDEVHLKLFVIPVISEARGIRAGVLARFPLSGQPQNGRAPTSANARRVDRYLEFVKKETGRELDRTAIWRAAGYADRRTFEEWQRGGKVSRKGAAAFERVLMMKPTDLLNLLVEKGYLPENPA
jgi:hypothetical protein